MNRKRYDYDAVFNFIVAYKMGNDGNSPTIRTLQDQFEISSTSVVHYILKSLEKSGKITMNNNTGQLINVVGGRWVYG